MNISIVAYLLFCDAPTSADTSIPENLHLMGEICPVLPVAESSGYHLTQLQELHVISDREGRLRPSNDTGLSGSVGIK